MCSPAASVTGLVFASEPDVFRLIMDLDKQRLVLGRHDSASNEYQRVSTDLGEIEACLRAAGLPSRDEFMTLQLCQGLAAAEPEPTPPPELPPSPSRLPRADLAAERERLQQELSQANSAQHERTAAERRVGEKVREIVIRHIIIYMKINRFSMGTIYIALSR